MSFAYDAAMRAAEDHECAAGALREELDIANGYLNAAREDVALLRARSREAAATIDVLRAVIAGRTTPPTDDEIEAHHGGWLAAALLGRFCDVDVYGAPIFVGHSEVRDGGTWEGRWWPLDADKRPCAWPVAGGAR